MIDTSFNYLNFRAHEILARVASDLLPKFTVSTKVGYFPASGGSEHSLAPDRLHAAVQQVSRDLGREPDLVFLHNPEQSLTELPEASAHERLAHACAVLADATARGLCGAWGISSWDPRSLAEPAAHGLPHPDVLMVRAGLLVGVEILAAAELVAARLRPAAVWGMSPFGGSTEEPVWERFDARVFLRDPQGSNPIQAAFRAACELPVVDAVAVGTNNVNHLHMLAEALRHKVDDQTLREYRTLLRARRQPA